MAAFLADTWALLRKTFDDFIEDDALSRGASIAYYTLFSVGPVLLIVIAIAGLVFGREAAQGAISAQLGGLMGVRTADALQGVVQSAEKSQGSSWWASIVGLVLLVLSASAVFGELQAGLNRIWEVPRDHRPSTLRRLLRARLMSLGLVATCGFLLAVSLAVSAGLAAVSTYLSAVFPTAQTLLQVADIGLSLLLTSGIFAAMYKMLPDADIAWHDVLIGAVASTLLVLAGKYLIALYVGQSDVASSFGAAGALIVFMVWVYYSSVIFLLGAEFTYAFACRHGSRADKERGGKENGPSRSERPVASSSAE